MDIGITGTRAIICGASKGLGYACARSLAREGVAVTIVARNRDTLERAAEDLRRETGGTVDFVAADVSTEEGRAAILEACPAPDILINNAGGPPPGDFRDWEREDWLKAIDANMLAPIFLIRAVVDGMMERGFGRILNITSMAVKAPIPILGLSNGARAGLTGFIAGLSRETVARGVTINNILPGMYLTDRLKGTIATWAKAEGVTAEQAGASRQEGIPAKRFGDPAEFGDLCAFYCSRQAGYMTGQNILTDGGHYPGTF